MRREGHRRGIGQFTQQRAQRLWIGRPAVLRQPYDKRIAERRPCRLEELRLTVTEGFALAGGTHMVEYQQGPAILTRNMANSRLWFETSSGIGLVASPDKIANYRGEFLKEELNVDLGDHVWLRWNPETRKVEAVYL